MNDVVTILIVHIPRQQGQSLLDFDQKLPLEAGSYFF
jgi:hypothetical protein